MGKKQRPEVPEQPIAPERHWTVEKWDGTTDEVTAYNMEIASGGTLVFYDEEAYILLAYSASHWATVSAQ